MREDAGGAEIMTIPGMEWLKYCFSKTIVRRALSTAMVVGVVLTAINYGEAILRGTLTSAQWIRMLLTFCVPYFVSTYSSVRTVFDINKQSSKTR